MSVPPPPPPAQDADTLLSALVASASVANTPAAGAARPSTAALGGIAVKSPLLLTLPRMR